MRLRQLVLACGLTSFVLSPYVSALGLGEVKLKSSLNQPLEAEVKLLDTRDLTAEQILVTLASPADFERNGVERLYFYSELQFQVDLESPDGPKVIIKSRNPVREPYLNFLIEARWTAGRLLREYTLLMDLPTFDEEASPAAVTSAPSVRSQTFAEPAAPSRAEPSTSSSTVSARVPAESKVSLSGDEYEVRANDTLWEIALRTRSDSGVSVHQSMMALYRANPEAFINGNINKLRRGQVLRVPDAGEMKTVSRAEALGQFAQASGDSELGAQLNASRRARAVSSESAEVSGRVKLAAPSSHTENLGQGSGADDGAGKVLESELAATLEELDKSKSENTELGARVKDLESQIETMERLVAVSNEKLRALQVAAGDTVVATESSVQHSLQASSADVAVEMAAVSSKASNAVAAKPITPKPNKVVPVAEPTLVDTLKDNALLIGLASLGVLGGAGAFVAYRRRKAVADQSVDETEDVFAMDDMIGEQEESLVDDHSNVEPTESSLFDEDIETTAVAETADVVGEADIYIAYGKLDQAEEMLLNALSKDPGSTDIRMKLLEVYSQQQNATAFDKQYAALLPVAGAALIVRANELREGIAGAGDFVEPGAGVGQDNSVPDDMDEFALDDFDLDDPADRGATLESGSVVSAADELDFEFDLNLDDDVAPLQSLSSDENSADVDEFNFALDDMAVGGASEDDLSELSLALDGLDDEALPVDVEATAIEADDEFNFEFDDELELLGQKESGAGSSIASESSEPLDVAADDFNLDMNVDDVDLAALDHEMESLDVDFDDDLMVDAEVGASIAEFASVEIAKDESEVGLDLDDDTLPLHEVEGFDLLEGDVASTGLVLTDDLDKPIQAQDVNFELDEELLELGSDGFESEDLGSSPAPELVAADFEEDFVVDFDDEELASLDAELNLSLADVNLSDSAASVAVEKSDVLESELGLSEEAFDFDGNEDVIAIDLPNDELELPDDSLPVAVEAVSETAVNLELDDEIPELESGFTEADGDSEDLELVKFAATTGLASEEMLSELEDEHEEDLFAEALSDFGSENDEIDLNNFNSDEAALADLSDDDMDSDLDFLAEADEAATKLDLARAYIDMGDADGAKDILAEVVNEGNDAQRQEANELLGRIV